MAASRWKDYNIFSYCNPGSVGLLWLIVGRGSGLLLIVPGGACMVVLLAGWIVVGSILLVLGGL